MLTPQGSTPLEPARRARAAPLQRAICGACALALALALALAGCASQRVPAEGRGSEACRVWQDSVCDWAERCQAASRGTCDTEYRAVTCKSDELANDCASDYDRADCRGLANCGLSQLADPAPATRACDALMSHYCERVVACGVWSQAADCLTSLRADVDCSRSVAYTLEYESCLASIDAMNCDTTSLPQVCVNVIIMRR